MFQPATLALVLVLLGASAARAQTPPTREQRQRTVTVNPAEPLPEIRVAKGTLTLVLFDASIRREAIELDTARVRIVDAGERSLILEPVSNPGAGERLVLRVPYAEGQPERAGFVLVAHPSEVDTRIDVERRAQPEAACQAELSALRAQCGARSPIDFVRAGYVDEAGVQTHKVNLEVDAASSFEADNSLSYRATGWALVEVRLKPLAGLPWVPREATLTSLTGESVRVRAVTAEPREMAPGRWGRVLVETDVPPPSAGINFTLEVRGADGRSLSVSKVILPLPPAKEVKR